MSIDIDGGGEDTSMTNGDVLIVDDGHFERLVAELRLSSRAPWLATPSIPPAPVAPPLPLEPPIDRRKQTQLRRMKLYKLGWEEYINTYHSIETCGSNTPSSSVGSSRLKRPLDTSTATAGAAHEDETEPKRERINNNTTKPERKYAADDDDDDDIIILSQRPIPHVDPLQRHPPDSNDEESAADDDHTLEWSKIKEFPHFGDEDEEEDENDDDDDGMAPWSFDLPGSSSGPVILLNSTNSPHPPPDNHINAHEQHSDAMEVEQQPNNISEQPYAGVNGLISPPPPVALAGAAVPPDPTIHLSAFFKEMSSMRTLLTTRLSVGPVFASIEQCVHQLLVASSTKSPSATKSPPIEAPAILTACIVHTKLKPMIIQLRSFFSFLQKCRDECISSFDFEMACSKFQLETLNLSSLFLFIIAFMDRNMSGVRVRMVMTKGLIPIMKSITSTNQSSFSTFSRLLTFLVRMHESSLLSSVIFPCLDPCIAVDTGMPHLTPTLTQILQGMVQSTSMYRLSNEGVLAVLHRICVDLLRCHEARRCSEFDFEFGETILVFLTNTIFIPTNMPTLTRPNASQVNELVDTIVAGRREGWTKLCHPPHALDPNANTAITLLATILLASFNPKLLHDGRFVKLTRVYIDRCGFEESQTHVIELLRRASEPSSM